MHLDPLLPQLVSIITLILLLGLLLKATRQPELIGYLIAGIVIGPSGFGFITDLQMIGHLGTIGVTLLLFFIGMEISPNILIKGWRVAIIGTLLQIIVSVMAVWAIGAYFDWSVARIVLLGFVISLSSTAVVLKLLHDRKELDKRAGQDVLVVLLAQDLAVVPMLIIIGFLGDSTIETSDLILQIVGGIISLGFAGWLLSRESVHLPFANHLKQDHELQVFAALLICFGFAFITGILQLSSALGAFLGGMLVASAKETDWVKENLESFRTVFMAFFFVSIGMLIDLQFIVAHWIQISALVIAVILTNTLINAGILKLLGATTSDSLYAGALLSQIGEFSFVLAAAGLQASIITQTAYQYTVAIIAISLLLGVSWVALIRRLTNDTA